MRRPKNFENRIAALEVQTGIGGPEPLLPPIIRFSGERPQDDRYWPAEQEDLSDWLTYQRWFQELQEQYKRRGASFLGAPFIADPALEAQARREKAENG